MKKKGPELPEAPKYYESQYYKESLDDLSRYGKALSSGGFLDPNDPDVGFLNQLVSLNPDATRQAIDLAIRPVVENRDVAQQNIINELAANNQLESSVTGNRLADLNQSFSGDISDISTQFNLADLERSFSNMSNLFQTGLNTQQYVGSTGLAEQGQQNQFNLANYPNQVAKSMQDFENNLGFFDRLGNNYVDWQADPFARLDAVMMSMMGGGQQPVYNENSYGVNNQGGGFASGGSFSSGNGMMNDGAGENVYNPGNYELSSQDPMFQSMFGPSAGVRSGGAF